MILRSWFCAVVDRLSSRLVQDELEALVEPADSAGFGLGRKVVGRRRRRLGRCAAIVLTNGAFIA
jgi:hypothetical protein